MKKLLLAILFLPTFAFAATPPQLVYQGGTGWGNFTAGSLLYGNGSLRLATTTAATQGYQLVYLNAAPTWVATTTYSSPLSWSNGAVSLSTVGTWSGNAGTATALAANGTNCSAGNYPLGVDASGNSENCTVATTGTLTSLGSGYATTTGTTITHSTSTLAFNGLTFGQTITVPNASTLLFTPTVTGTLSNSGLANSTISGVALGGTLNSHSHGSTLSGTSYNGSASVSNWDIDLTHSNSWTGQQTFNTSAPIFGTLSGLLQGNGASAITAVAGTAGQFPYYNGSNTVLATSTLFVSTASYVGIGTTSPQYQLHVWNNANANVRLAFEDPNDGAGSTAGFRLIAGTGGNDAVMWKQTAANNSYGGPDSLNIYKVGNTPIAFLTNDTLRMKIMGTGEIGIGTAAPAAALDINATSTIIRTASTPSSSSAPCTTGTISWDTSFVYVCTTTNTWKRATLNAF